MLLFLWLHSRVGKSTLPPSLGHETRKGKDKVQSQHIGLFTAPCTHASTLTFFLLPPCISPSPLHSNFPATPSSAPCSPALGQGCACSTFCLSLGLQTRSTRGPRKLS